MNNEYDNFGFNTDNSSNIKPSNIDYSQAKPKPAHLTSTPKQPVQQQPMINQGMPQQEEVVPNEQYYSMGFNTEQPKKKNKGGGFFSFLLALLLVIGLSLFLLDYTGKVDVRKYVGKYYGVIKQKVLKNDKKEDAKEVEEEKKDEGPKEEIAKMCSNVNESGAYNEQALVAIEEKTGTNINANSSIEDVWNIYKGAKYCSENECYIFEDSDSHVFYMYDCVDKEYQKNTMEEYILSEQSNYYLTLSCSNIREDGSIDSQEVLMNDELKVADSLICENNVCKVTISGKEFIRNCKE